jgi:hypothetical protein
MSKTGIFPSTMSRCTVSKNLLDLFVVSGYRRTMFRIILDWYYSTGMFVMGQATFTNSFCRIISADDTGDKDKTDAKYM